MCRIELVKPASDDAPKPFRLRLSWEKSLDILVSRWQAESRKPKGFFAFRDRQGALADGLHGLNPQTPFSRYTPRRSTELDAGIGNDTDNSGGITRSVDKVNASLMGTWAVYV
jgi:hypothetical protein